MVSLYIYWKYLRNGNRSCIQKAKIMFLFPVGFAFVQSTILKFPFKTETMKLSQTWFSNFTSSEILESIKVQTSCLVCLENSEIFFFLPNFTNEDEKINTRLVKPNFEIKDTEDDTPILIYRCFSEKQQQITSQNVQVFLLLYKWTCLFSFEHLT